MGFALATGGNLRDALNQREPLGGRRVAQAGFDREFELGVTPHEQSPAFGQFEGRNQSFRCDNAEQAGRPPAAQLRKLRAFVKPSLRHAELSFQFILRVMTQSAQIEGIELGK